jgi:hypothetical protein
MQTAGTARMGRADPLRTGNRNEITCPVGKAAFEAVDFGR